MKKITILIAAMFLALCFTSCGKTENHTLSVVTTIFPEYDFVRQIAGDKAENTLLIPVGSELHSYEPTPKDIMKIQNCDVFIYVGGESDAWIDEILKTLDTDSMKIIKLADITETENIKHNHLHESYDEHVWTSPVNAVKIVEVISEYLQEADVSNAEFYKLNAEEYIKELKLLDEEFKSVVSTSERKLMVFADRYPLKHFSDEYNLEYISAFPGCNDEAEPSVTTVTDLIDEVKKNNIPVVFYTELSNQKMADTICEATGAKKRRFNSCHNVTKDEFESGITYVDLMKHNLTVLKEALN